MHKRARNHKNMVMLDKGTKELNKMVHKGLIEGLIYHDKHSHRKWKTKCPYEPQGKREAYHFMVRNNFIGAWNYVGEKIKQSEWWKDLVENNSVKKDELSLKEYLNNERY